MSKPFATAWLNGEQGALALLPGHARSVPARAEAVHIAAQKSMDPKLLAVVRAQNAALPPSAARERHLDLLAQSGTVIVATGQQVGLFLGPLYTLYKVATAITAARQLTVETGVACVPLFWLPTEDHDFAEIDHCFLPRTGGEPLKIALAASPPSRVPVAHRTLGPSVTDALAELETALAGLPHAADVLAWLRSSYMPQAPVARAFAQALATLFADEGLVFFDPHDLAVAPFTAPFHRQCVLDAAAISQQLQRQATLLENAGFEPQVHIRPGSPLSFVAPDAIDGPRYRLDPVAQSETWLLVGHPQQATVTTAQLLAWTHDAPQRFTTSALSRPVLQDVLLPTVGYVGGPGEMAYFAQLGPLYAYFSRPMPLPIHRDRFALLDERSQSFLRERNLKLGDLARPRDELLRALASPPGAPTQQARLATMMAGLHLDELSREMTAVDPNLGKAVVRTRDAVEDALGKLLDKHARALAQRDQVAMERLERARQWLMPNGEPQERVFGITAFAARFGMETLKQTVLAACRPFAGELQELTL